ncbi:MAG: hypothetical protein ABIR50_04455, partial [Ginsengibacter sp.]
MKIVKRVLFVLLTILFCSNQLHAQSNFFDTQDLSQVNIDDLSDSQIISLYNKAIESGISETKLYKLAEEKGLPDAEIVKLKDRIESINSGKKIIRKNNPEKSEQTDDESLKEPHPYDTSGIKGNFQKFKNDESIFGSELFTTSSTVFEPNLRIPAPVGYVLGPDDEIVIS